MARDGWWWSVGTGGSKLTVIDRDGDEAMAPPVETAAAEVAAARLHGPNCANEFPALPGQHDEDKDLAAPVVTSQQQQQQQPSTPPREDKVAAAAISKCTLAAKGKGTGKPSESRGSPYGTPPKNGKGCGDAAEVPDDSGRELGGDEDRL